MIRVRPVARLAELRLLIWVAALSLVGYVAVVAAASGRFAWYEIAVPVVVRTRLFGPLQQPGCVTEQSAVTHQTACVQMVRQSSQPGEQGLGRG